MNRTFKILIAICAVLLIMVGSYRVWMPRVLAGYALFELRNKKIENTPVPIQLKSPTSQSGTSITFATLQLMVPWSDELNTKGNNLDDVMYSFKNPNSITGSSTIIILKEVSIKDGLADSLAKRPAFFGPELKTNYDYYNRMIALSPSQVHLLHPPSEFLPEVLLLGVKAVTVPPTENTIFSFNNTHQVRGFYFNLTSTSTMATVFTPDDAGYSVTIVRANSSEVESILNSLK